MNQQAEDMFWEAVDGDGGVWPGLDDNDDDDDDILSIYSDLLLF